MGRSTTGILDPIKVMKQYCRWYYRFARTGVTHQLYFFSKFKSECERLLVFGGNVYKTPGGYCWMCGKTKQLVAIYKLMTPFVNETADIKAFARWARVKSKEY